MHKKNNTITFLTVILFAFLIFQSEKKQNTSKEITTLTKNTMLEIGLISVFITAIVLFLIYALSFIGGFEFSFNWILFTAVAFGLLFLINY